MPDRALATELARALDGHGTRVAEAEELALLLRSVADMARFEVSADETEQALESARRRVSPSPARPVARRGFTPRRAFVGTLAAAALAVAALIALPESHAPGVDVESRALAAITRGAPILQAVTQTTVPERADRIVRTEWVDSAGGRVRVQIMIDGIVVSETLREPDRVTQYQSQTGRTVIAPSCDAIPGGCAALVDPIGFYRRALEQRQAGEATKVEFAGRPAYRFTLPVQALGGATNLIQQRVTVDAATFLPVRVVWTETPEGESARTVAVIDVRSVSHLDIAQASDAFALNVPSGTPIVQLSAGGSAIGSPQVRTASPAEARRALPNARWLGRSYQGFALDSVSIVRWQSAGAVAIRLRYGPLTLWSFGGVIPDPLLEGAVVPQKLISDGNGVVRFYVARDGRLVAERDYPEISVAVIGPELEKLDLFAAVDATRPL
ncbi:MAG: hypothetical protein QOJ13_123 [Gaiellales bacterium]|nr:hypothetical protein [Gaiellales bacterium]